jgi:cysteinyl-tRNA synthetase, unknown class
MALRASFAAGSLAVATVLVCLAVGACGGADSDPVTPDPNPPDKDGSVTSPDGGGTSDTSTPGPTGPGLGPGFPNSGPWTSFYGTAAEMGDLAKVASTFRIINIDVDPTSNNFTTAQIQQLKAGGKNTVISYMNVGSCEKSREYWDTAPGFVPCGQNTAAQIGPYEGYPDEIWMDPSSEDYQKLIVEYVAPRLVARGIDGFYLDNMELISHEPDEDNGPCKGNCKAGGLELIRKLRAKFPDMLIVMQNGTGDVTRLGVTADGTEFRRLLDGIAHEEVYQPAFDKTAETELLAWKAMDLKSRTGKPFVILVEDYVGDCDNTTDAFDAIDKSVAKGFSPYVSDDSGEQRVVCYWGKP